MPLADYGFFAAFFRWWGRLSPDRLVLKFMSVSPYSRVGGARFPVDISNAKDGRGMLLPEGRAGYHGTLTDEFTRSGNG
jgi:hypothetical protein